MNMEKQFHTDGTDKRRINLRDNVPAVFYPRKSVSSDLIRVKMFFCLTRKRAGE
jgi:hypothetical protein